jgi:hypothetical protein
MIYTDLQLVSPTFGTGQVVQKSNCKYGIYFAAPKYMHNLSRTHRVGKTYRSEV